MMPGPLHHLGTPDDSARPAGPGLFPERLVVGRTGPDEPIEVIATGPADAGRAGVLAALSDLDVEMLDVPAGSWLVVRHATTASRAAYVPGYRMPASYRPELPAVGPALARPPRRVELSLPKPVLKWFGLVDTPDIESLGQPGTGVLLDAVGRAGALLFVIAADQSFSGVALNLLAEVAAASVPVFFAVTPAVDVRTGPVPAADVRTGPVPAADVRTGAVVDQVSVSIAAHRAALLAVVPGLAAARWFPIVDADVEELRQALVDWSSDEVLRRGSAPPQPPGFRDRVPVLDEPGDWSESLDRQLRAATRRIRQHLALSLADLHRRAVQEILFGVGCAGLPRFLDRELEAISLLVTAQCDQLVRTIVGDVAGRLFGAPLPEGVHRRIDDAVSWGLTYHTSGPELRRALLVTSGADVTGMTGAAAVDAMSAYPAAVRTELLPPLAVALAGGCWQHWRTPGRNDPDAARAWVQRALREVELELPRELARRFEVIRLSLGTVLSDAADRGTLLA
ncbi:hypothetical protein [Micromonospora endophytica]|uniref:Uncharacterized protein n=1 Tax=Micromonospora endophytica TaxID=515350 RepID=A0A2W2CKQ7_9ACTN|nr:hypothetical protein [Micromonospora endophytica]PZF99092.1 hypothetical protein C1I93_06980 [Micromonospora endophytica]RIW41950.1 hypothetical protein D3H59_24675 [Micromonospora endophytica]BCJ58269.1 hypothetical protein Jiend_16910 [Micromonospora endophytica]